MVILVKLFRVIKLFNSLSRNLFRIISIIVVISSILIKKVRFIVMKCFLKVFLFLKVLL